VGYPSLRAKRLPAQADRRDNFIEFAEGRQAEVDALADNAAKASHAHIDSWIAAVKKHLTDAKNLRSAGETIADLYTHDSRFAEALADALLAADRVGVDSVAAELGDDGAGQDFARRHGNADLHDAGRNFARRQKLSFFSRRSPRPVRGRWFPVGSGLRPEPTHGPTGGDNFIEFAETQWGPGKPFEDAVDFFKARSFTIAGVSNADLLGDVRSEIIRAMEEGRTLKDFRADVDALFDRRGWTRLKPHRVRTIFQTNIQGAYQAARHRQMTSPAVTAARPYWRYVSIDDAVTRPEHRALHGKIFRHDHPFWATWYPPNGWNCRCHAQTVSQRELERNNWTVETEDPTGGLFEPVTPDGVTMPARPLMPDRGWGGQPKRLAELMDDQSVKSQVWREVKDQKGPEPLGRLPEKKIPQADLPPAPAVLDRLQDYMAANKVSRDEALKYFEDQYRFAMGISPNESMSVLRDPDGGAVTVDLRALAHMMRKRPEARERYIPYLRETIENPYEIILTEYESAGGDRTHRKKYVKIYQAKRRLGIIITAEIGKDGSVIWNILNTSQGKIDKRRKGARVLYGK